MKYIFYIILVSILFSTNLHSQEKTKLIYADNFTQAKELSAKQNKYLLLIFSGSDWCKPCMMLDINILKDSLFANYANKNLIVYRADFPRRKKNKLSKDKEKHNNQLASKYNKRGEFPKVILFSPDAKIKATLIYNHVTPSEFINQIKKYKK